MDFSSWLEPGALGTVVVLAIVVASLARVEHLGSAFRLRKRLKEELELAEKLPNGEQKLELFRLIDMDMAKYNDVRNPAHKHKVFDRFTRVFLTVSCLFMVTMITNALFTPSVVQQLEVWDYIFIVSVGLGCLVLIFAFSYSWLKADTRPRKRAGDRGTEPTKVEK